MNMIEKKMTTKEVAEICGVTEKTVRENAKTFGKTFENGKPTEWTEEELKKLQVVLMKNQMSQGTETNGGVVEYSLNTGVQVETTLETPEDIKSKCLTRSFRAVTMQFKRETQKSWRTNWPDFLEWFYS